jgi:hypothetical protein
MVATMTQFNWRKHLKVHPAAELFPLMTEDELRELGEDIKKNGLRSPIVMHRGKVLDGRNRLDAMELVGIAFTIIREPLHLEYHAGAANSSIIEDCDGDPYNFVLSANLYRRHLTSEQKRELINKVLKARPEQSDRQIAKQVKADDKTVAKVRSELEARSEIPNVKIRTDAKGRKQPSTKPKKPAPPPPVPAAKRAVPKPPAKAKQQPDPDAPVFAMFRRRAPNAQIECCMKLISLMERSTLAEFDLRYAKYRGLK